MGTAGPLALARDKLLDGKGSPFFVLNADGATCHCWHQDCNKAASPSLASIYHVGTLCAHTVCTAERHSSASRGPQ